MRFDKIDIVASKKKGRLIRKGGLLARAFEIVFNAAVYGWLPIIIGTLFLLGLSKGIIDLSLLPWFIAGLLISGVLFSAIWDIGRLRRVKGLNPDENRLAVKETAKDLGWHIRQNNRDFLIARPTPGWSAFNRGQDVTVIHDGPDILVHAVSYGRSGSISPLYWFANRRLRRELEDKFLMKTAGGFISPTEDPGV